MVNTLIKVYKWCNESSESRAIHYVRRTEEGCQGVDRTPVVSKRALKTDSQHKILEFETKWRPSLCWDASSDGAWSAEGIYPIGALSIAWLEDEWAAVWRGRSP